MAQGKGGVPGGPPTQVNKLDNMLGSLQSDLNKLGVQTVAKGVCGACCKPIVGQVRRSVGNQTFLELHSETVLIISRISVHISDRLD